MVTAASALRLGLYLAVFEYANSKEDLAQMGLDACGVDRFCSGNVRVPSNMTGCCRPCSCDRSCVVSRNCCPDADIDLTNLQQYFDPYRSFSTCNHNILWLPDDRHLVEYETLFFMMVSKCRDNWSCKSRELNSSTDELSSQVVVSDRATGTIFINKHCAYCHGATDIVEWHLEVTRCAGDMSMLFEDLSSGTLSVSQVLGKCTIAMLPPLPIQAISVRMMCGSMVFSKCNTTRSMDSYSNQVETACSSGMFEIFSSVRMARVYRNPYCFYCNEPGNRTAEYLQTFCQPKRNDWKTIFSQHGSLFRLLGDVDNPGTNDDPDCGISEMHDRIQGICRPLFCPPFLRPQHGKCEQIPLLLRQYRFIVFLKFTRRISPAMVLPSAPSISAALAASLLGHVLDLTHLRSECLLASTMVPYTDSKNVGSGFYVGVEATPTTAECYFTRLYKHLGLLYLGNITVGISNSLFNVSIIDFPVFLNETLIDHLHVLRILSRIEHLESVNIDIGHSIEKLHGDLGQIDYPLVKINRPYSCPFVKVNLSEICMLQGTEECTMSNLPYNGNIHVVPDLSDLQYMTFQYRICVDKYYDMFRSSKPSAEAIEGIVSLVMSSLSLLCIVVTVISVLQNVRIDPSTRRIFLSSVGNLFVAQSTFQFGSGWIYNQVICEITGIALHYSWLATVLSFNSFCMLVYRRIQSLQTKIDMNKDTVFLLMYTYSVPAALVVVNMTYSLADSGGSDIGYGNSGTQCNLNSALMRGILFALPIFAAVTCNIFVFSLIVRTIRSIPDVTKTSRMASYVNAVVYFRLLMFTGIGWFIGFINEFVQSAVLGILFAIAIGGQGIGFCLAFVWNGTRSGRETGSSKRPETSVSTTVVTRIEKRK